jgi:hypothetical protein
MNANSSNNSFQSTDPSRRLHRSNAADASEQRRFILTDPPYLVNYRDRCGRTIQNDAKPTGSSPAMRRSVP